MTNKLLAFFHWIHITVKMIAWRCGEHNTSIGLFTLCYLHWNNFGVKQYVFLINMINNDAIKFNRKLMISIQLRYAQTNKSDV